MYSDTFSLVDHGGKVTSSIGLTKCYKMEFMETSAPLVSIVIPIYNQLEYTLKCLHSISKHTAPGTYEVIIVDDCSDLSVHRALSEIPNIRILRNFENLGFVRGCNRGASHARGEYVLLLNNDTEVTPGWLEELLRVFSIYPDAGLVGAKLIYPDRTLQEAGGIIWQDASGWNYGRNDDPALPWYNYIRETDYCSGACIILPRDLWKLLGGFDLRYVPAYYEDTDIAFRVRAAGRKVYYQPHAEVVHYEGKSNGTDIGGGIKKYQVENHARFYERWKDVLQGHLPNAQQVHRARGRRFKGKTILFIDHYLPHYDQDAGSKNIYSYIKLFLREGFHVQFIGDNFFPHQPYQKHLEELGVEVLTGHYMQHHWNEWLNANGASLDYVLFSRAVTCERWVAPVKACTKAKLLFYGHDLISRTLMRAFEQYGNPKHRKEARFWQVKEDFMIQSCDGIYYPSELEVAELRKRYPAKVINAVPLYTFESRDRSKDKLAGQREGIIFVGSFGHPPNVDAIEWMLTDVMPKMRVLLPELKFHVVGKNPPQRLLGLAGSETIFHGYLSDPDLRSLLNNCRVSVAPLRIGGGIKGKILEAFYNGIPVATTSIGIEAIPAGDGECLVVKDLKNFASELASFYVNLELLNQLSEKAYRKVLEYCSYKSLASAFSEIVSELKTDSFVPQGFENPCQPPHLSIYDSNSIPSKESFNTVPVTVVENGSRRSSQLGL